MVTWESILRGAALAVLVFAAGGAVRALAHHGWSSYGSDGFTLNGTVETVSLGYPHAELTVAAEGETWDVVLAPPGRTESAGVTEETVKVGDVVTAFGQRHQDPERLEIKTERLTVGDRVYEIYPERL